VGVSRAADLVARAGAAQPAVDALGLDERLARAGASRAALAAAGPQIVDLAVREAGQARRFARRELESALALLDALPVLCEPIRPRPVPAASGATWLEWRPYGVVYGWHAANSPVWVPTLVAASALVGGNAVVCRPSRRTERTSGLALAALAGAWPDDALAVLEGVAPQEAERLVADPGVHAVVAHASTATCKRHLALLGAAYAAGAPLRPYIPEASGNDALVVLAGADMQRAAAAAALGGFANAGQLCMAAKRLVVERAAWPAFRPALERAVGALVVGDPDDEATEVAPLPEGAARERARAALAEARAAGAELVVGEGERGRLFTPTVALLPRDALGVALWREESFAPLRGLVLAEDPADALALANDSAFGLGAAVFGPPERAAPVVAGLRAARVVVDEGPLYADPHLVVGGVADSGLGGARPKVEQLVWARRVHRAAASAPPAVG
jgi:acyl-CoA reductase-like NAD-dependent aldehyde dehydrogenase